MTINPTNEPNSSQVVITASPETKYVLRSYRDWCDCLNDAIAGADDSVHLAHEFIDAGIELDLPPSEVEYRVKFALRRAHIKFSRSRINGWVKKANARLKATRARANNESAST